MKIPMKWLREYVDVNMAPQEYAAPHDHDRHRRGRRGQDRRTV